MIIKLSEGAARLAMRVKETGSGRQLIDWHMMQLLIQPGQHDECCGPNGSPWYLHGCWPMHPTGVDIANHRPDFPTICYNAFELDEEGRVVFMLDHHLWTLPHGRYTGILRLYPHGRTPVNLKCLQDVGRKAPKPGVIIPPEFEPGAREGCIKTEPMPVPPPPPPQCCILSTFDIDLGPLCSDHIVDQVSVENVLINCEEL